MGFHDDLARIAQDPEVRRLAEWRARSRYLAEDALQETWRAIAQRKSPETIRDLNAFFRTSLIREIRRQLGYPGPIPIDDLASVSDRRQDQAAAPSGSLPAAVEEAAQTRVLAEKILARFERDRDELMAMVPARSNEPSRYQYAIVRAARAIFCLLVQGTVVSADWNDLIRAEYPVFYAPPDGRGWPATVGEPALAGGRRADSATTKKDQNSIDQRLRRARQDVRSLLQVLLVRCQFAL